MDAYKASHPERWRKGENQKVCPHSGNGVLTSGRKGYFLKLIIKNGENYVDKYQIHSN
jgi:hypothetical protein